MAQISFKTVISISVNTGMETQMDSGSTNGRTEIHMLESFSMG